MHSPRLVELTFMEDALHCPSPGQPTQKHALPLYGEGNQRVLTSKPPPCVFSWALRITTKFGSRLNNSEGALHPVLETPSPLLQSLYDASSTKGVAGPAGL